MDTEASIIETFKRTRLHLAEEFKSNNDAFNYLSEHSLAADKAVLAFAKLHNLSNRIAIIPIGGYGRKQLFPFSDLDLLFLLPDSVLDQELSALHEVLNSLWSLGLNVGHSVRTIAECIEQASQDITAQTAMLESRFLFGDKENYDRYSRQMESFLNPNTFFRAKFIEQEQRHLKFHESSYALEPNIKESPGGLRDLNILIWVLRAAHQGSDWNEVYLSGLITKREKDLLESATNNLYRLRIFMHLLTNRHEDRLVFEIQETLAKQMGFFPLSERRASEVLMQRYYVNAKTIGQINSIILQALKEKYLAATLPELSAEVGSFLVRGDTLDIKNEQTFENNPRLILKAFLFPLQHPEVQKKSARLYRALFGAHHLMNEAFAEYEENKKTFLAILQSRRGVWQCLDEMNRWGVLGRLLPNFKKIVGQMQHDLFHAYTVDQHTLLAIKYLRHFTHSENAHEMPLCTELMMALKDNWRLTLALLYHDIGKGRGGDHSKIGAEEIKRMAESYHLKKEDAEYVEFLVREHLTMSQVAQKQDTSDPEVTEAFAKKIGSMDRLIGLYLLTVCDIRATSPKIWNDWKAQLLEDLFYAAARHLRGKSITRERLVYRRRRDAIEMSKLSFGDREKINKFWDQLDVAYFMRHSVRNIVWHAKTLLPHLGESSSFVATRALRGLKNAHEVLVLTFDKPELFARIVSAFQKMSLSILEARIHTGKNSQVLDSFIVVDDGSDPAIEQRLKEFEKNLARSLDQATPLAAASKGRLSRQSRSFPILPEVSFRPDAGGRQFLLSITCSDRLGLLASVARVFVNFKLNLITARIATLGERAEDIFLVEGKALEDPSYRAEIEKKLLETLEN